ITHIHIIKTLKHVVSFSLSLDISINFFSLKFKMKSMLVAIEAKENVRALEQLDREVSNFGLPDEEIKAITKPIPNQIERSTMSASHVQQVLRALVVMTNPIERGVVRSLNELVDGSLDGAKGCLAVTYKKFSDAMDRVEGKDNRSEKQKAKEAAKQAKKKAKVEEARNQAGGSNA
ncbi:unnamed protein product, partial [Arabidopsis halleri]